MTSKEYFCHCLCGQVQFSIGEEVRDLCCCHCESCRRAVGGPFVAWGTVDLVNFNIVKGKIVLVNSSPNVERGFCGNCGSSLTYKHTSRNTEIDFTLASLNGSTTLAPHSHIWVQDKLPWVKIADGLPQYETTNRSK